MPNRDSLITRLRSEAEEFRKIAPRVQWYLFGSYSRPESATTASDVDILIVFPESNRSDVISLHDKLAQDFRLQDLDVTLLTDEEERSLQFIRHERAVAL
ncbi:nucleotidyltransferase domain-containing protein [Streptomyces sp. NPDC127038]|uniref:nucleotidyltransferase domain-containing protein n=1 Tax=Streptomyces sp. NPDC127038 TaxID=3347114 RepID=UPI0036673E32